MSEWTPVVVQLGKVGKHPHADELSITHVLGSYPVIFRTEDFKAGDKAVYIPVETLVPLDEPRFAFLDKPRIRARRLRNIFSMGLLVPADPEWPVGMDVRYVMGLKKYEPPMLAALHGLNEHAPEGAFPAYDLEALRKNPEVLLPREHVVITEKIHGTNARFRHDGTRLYVGSHHCWKKRPAEGEAPNVWWEVALREGMDAKLAAFPGYTLYGEIFGWVQDLKYGARPHETFFRVFDLQMPDGRYVPWAELETRTRAMGLNTVPRLYEAPWYEDLKEMANGVTTVMARGEPHMREGVVIQSEPTRYDHIGRVKLKHIGEQYLLRKEGKSPIMGSEGHRAGS